MQTRNYQSNHRRGFPELPTKTWGAVTSPQVTVRFESEYPVATNGTPRRCAQSNISDREHGQLAIPLDGPGRRVSWVERSQDSSANVLEWSSGFRFN